MGQANRLNKRLLLVGLASLMILGLPREGDTAAPLRLLQVGDKYRVTTKSTLNGSLDMPAQGPMRARALTVTGTARVSYRERVLHANDQGLVDKVFRVYDDVDYRRKVDDQDQQAALRPTVRRVVLQQRQGVEVPYSPDGPLTWPEIDLIGTHPHLPLLEKFLGTGDWTPGATWDAPQEATAELTGLNPVEMGKLVCRVGETMTHEGKTLLQVAFAGEVTGLTEDGRSRHHINGAVYVDTTTGRMVSLRATGDRQMLDKEKVVGRVEVDFSVVVAPLETDEQLDAITAEQFAADPTEEMMALLHENPILGVRLVHPRRWFLANVEGNQLMLHTRGSYLVIHVERAGQTPTAAAYLQEVRGYLEKSKINATQQGEMREAVGKAGRIANFRFEALLDGQKRFLDYWAIDRKDRGATLAARVEPADAIRSLGDVENMARSLRFTDPLEPIGPSNRLQPPTPSTKPRVPIAK